MEYGISLPHRETNNVKRSGYWKYLWKRGGVGWGILCGDTLAMCIYTFPIPINIREEKRLKGIADAPAALDLMLPIAVPVTFVWANRDSQSCNRRWLANQTRTFERS